MVSATWDDVPHLSQRQKDELWEGIPIHEREARAKGIPVFGSGRIFPVDVATLIVPAFTVERHWPQLGALDFGWDHPTAGIKLAWDRDNDCVYVTNAYRVREAIPLIHAAALKAWGEWLPWAWPHDGLQHSKDSGVALADQYRKHGLKLMIEHAKYPDGSTGVEAGLMDMLDRMQTGRLKVFSHLNDWFAEFRLYHRKDGKVVKESDDLMSATRYGIMCLSQAATQPEELDRYARQRRPRGGWMSA